MIIWNVYIYIYICCIIIYNSILCTFHYVRSCAPVRDINYVNILYNNCKSYEVTEQLNNDCESYEVTEQAL